jgi:hypothetical protein
VGIPSAITFQPGRWVAASGGESEQKQVLGVSGEDVEVRPGPADEVRLGAQGLHRERQEHRSGCDGHGHGHGHG